MNKNGIGIEGEIRRNERRREISKKNKTNKEKYVWKEEQGK